jgi:glycosyltransferase involved in cell wall biosynthesis
MKIGIDARLLNTRIRGTHRYLSNVIKYIPQFDKVNEYFIFQYETTIRNNEFYSYIPIRNSRLPRQVFEHYWLNFILPKYLTEHNIDIFFTPYIFVPFLKNKWKNVIAIHDALTKTCKEYYTWYYKKYMDLLVPPSIKRSDSIITVSESARTDIIKHYKVPPDKIHALHLWTDYEYKPINIIESERKSLLKKYQLPEEFILFVGVIEERKNINGILKISETLHAKGTDIKFVLVGREGFGFENVAEKIRNSNNRIIHLKDVDEKDLVSLYNLATIFLFPSHYEGFGLPPLEAMKCGLPVLASNSSSLPEIVGDGGILGNSNDYEFFADSIVKLLKDEKFYFLMKIKAIEQAKKFTAENHITKLIYIFNTIK